MIEFNPDGSIKLPGSIAEEKDKKNYRMRSTRCASVRKELVSKYPPKTCKLHVKLSERINDPKWIELAFDKFRTNAETPVKVVKIDDKEYDIEIGSNFRRCSECNMLVGRLRDILDGNVIVDKGSCTFKEREFCYEDYFE